MLWRALLLPIVVFLAFIAVSCGGSSKSSQPALTTYAVQTVETPSSSKARNCKGLSKSKQAAQRRRVERDLRALRAAVATMPHYAQDGSPAMNKAVDRFEIDIAVEALPVFQRSRFIDLAAAIVAPHCYLCFQALESNRPVGATGKLPCD